MRELGSIVKETGNAREQGLERRKDISENRKSKRNGKGQKAGNRETERNLRETGYQRQERSERFSHLLIKGNFKNSLFLFFRFLSSFSNFLCSLFLLLSRTFSLSLFLPRALSSSLVHFNTLKQHSCNVPRKLIILVNVLLYPLPTTKMKTGKRG